MGCKKKLNRQKTGEKIYRAIEKSGLTYFESEEGKKAFAEWMEKKNVLQNESFATQSKKDGE